MSSSLVEHFGGVNPTVNPFNFLGKCDNTQRLKRTFLLANKGIKSPWEANMLYEMFINMRKNEDNSYIDIVISDSNITRRSEKIVNFISNIKYLRYRYLPEIYRVVRLWDYLTTHSSYVKNLSSTKLSQLLEEIRKLLMFDIELDMMVQIPELMFLLNKIIIHPPTIYDFFLFYNSIIPLTPREKKDIKFLCLMFLHSPDIYKYPSSMIAVSLMDIIMVSRDDYTNGIIYNILDEYCGCSTDIYRNCLTDMLIFFRSVIKIDKKCSLTLMQICKQIKTCINSVPTKYHIDNNVFDNNENVISINRNLKVFEIKPIHGSIIGNGSYGNVYKIKNHKKLVMKKFFDGESLIEFIKITNLNNSYISRVSGICKTHFNILFYKRATSDLQKYVDVLEAPMDKRLIRSYMKQIITATAYCHSNMITHQDIKPSNIVLHKDEKLELIDFGGSYKFNPFIKDVLLTVTTRLYCPPEILLEFKRYCSHIATDMWSVGCCMAFMLSKGQMKFFQPIVPNVSLTDDDIINNINDLCLHSNWKDIIPDISPLEEDFLSSLLKYDPRERMNALQALSHPYIN